MGPQTRLYWIVGACALGLLATCISPPPACAGEGEEVQRLIARGIEQVNQGNPGDALPLLEEAITRAPDSSEAAYWAGVAAARSARFSEAEGHFEEVLRLDPGATEAATELIRLYTVTAQCEPARKTYRTYLASAEDPNLAAEAQQWLERCAPSKKRVTTHRYHINLTVGAQHDSNVLLEPSNPPQGEGDRSDYRAVANLHATGDLVNRDHLRLHGDYSFYQSAHRNLDDFNVQQHRLGAEVVWLAAERIHPRAGYTLEYVFFGGDDYSLNHNLHLALDVLTSDSFTTQVRYEFENHDYRDTDRFQGNEIRSGHRNTLGIRQRYARKGLTLRAHYLFDLDRTRAAYWDHNGYRLGADAMAALSPRLYLVASGELQRAWYGGDYPGETTPRQDSLHKYSIGLHYLLSKRLRVSVSDTVLRDHSNLDLFNYRRNVAGLFLTVGI